MVDISSGLDPDLIITVRNRLSFYSEKFFSFGIILGSIVALSIILILFGATVWAYLIRLGLAFLVIAHLIVAFYMVDLIIFLYRYIQGQFNRQSPDLGDRRYTIRDERYKQISGVEQENAVALFYSLSSISIGYAWWHFTSWIWQYLLKNRLPDPLSSVLENVENVDILSLIVSALTGVPISEITTHLSPSDISLYFRLIPTLFLFFIGFRYFSFLVEKFAGVMLSKDQVLKPVSTELGGFGDLVLETTSEVVNGDLKEPVYKFVLSIIFAGMVFTLFLRLGISIYL